MNMTRKDFLKGLFAGVGIAALPAVKAVSSASEVKTYFYSGCPMYDGMKFGPSDVSVEMSYNDVVRHTAMELFRIDGLIRSGRFNGTYFHTVAVYTDGEFDKIYYIGENANIGLMNEEELNDPFILNLKADVEDYLFRIKNGIS